MNQSLRISAKTSLSRIQLRRMKADSPETKFTLTFPTMKMFQLVTTALTIYSVFAILAPAFARAEKGSPLAGKSHITSRPSSP